MIIIHELPRSLSRLPMIVLRPAIGDQGNTIGKEADTSGGGLKPSGSDSLTPRRREVALPLEIGCHTVIETLGQVLTVLGLPEELLVRWVAQKRDFGQHRGHIRSNQDHKRRATHPAVLRAAGRALA